MNDQKRIPKTISGWPVVVDPDDEKIRKLIKTGFTGLVYYKTDGGIQPWAVWHLGHSCTFMRTQEEAKKEIEKIAGRKE